MNHSITNATIVTRTAIVKGGVSIDGGVFQTIGTSDSEGVNFEGDYLIPGLIDLHTDNLERQYFPRPNVGWDPGSAAIIHDRQCLASGVTTIFDSLSIGSWSGDEGRHIQNMSHLLAGLNAVRESGHLGADHHVHWRCEVTNPLLPDLFERLIDESRVSLLSVMDHTPGQRQYANLEKHFARWRDYLGMTEEAARERYETLLSNQTEYGHKNRTYIARRAAELGVPLASHDDETVAHVDEALSFGATISEFPTTLDAAQRAKDSDMVVIMGAPNLMRGGSYSGNVAAADVAQTGLLDIFTSDYVPRSMIEAAFKLTEAPFDWSLPEAIATVSDHPAKAVGLEDRGQIAIGKRADFIRVRLVDQRPMICGVWVGGNRVA